MSAQPKSTRIIVAASDLKLGMVLRDADLSTTEMVGPLPKGAITSRDKAVGRGVISDIFQGEPIWKTGWQHLDPAVGWLQPFVKA